MSKKSRAISELDKEKRKQTIMFAALEQFYLQGFKATRMDDIATMANVSKGTLYLYFKTKEELFEGLINSIALPKMGEISQLLGNSPSVKDGLTLLFRFIPTVILHSPLPKLIKVIISDSFSFPDVVKHYRENVLSKGLQALNNLLEKGKASGEIAAVDTQMMARLVVAPVIFSVIWYMVLEADNKDEATLNQLFAQHLSNLFRALGIEEV